MIRVLVIDDVPLAREKLRHLLAAHADIDIRGEAGDLEQARRLLRQEVVDLLLLDIQMPGDDGMQLARQLPSPAPLPVRPGPLSAASTVARPPAARPNRKR